MGIFRRRGRPEPDPEPTGTEPDAYLAPLSVAEAAHVAAIARDQLASLGREATIRQGALVLDDGTTAGLGNLSRILPDLPRESWDEVVRGHMSSLVNEWNRDDDEPVDPATVLVKLRPLADLPPDFLTYQPLEPVPGIAGVLAADLPEVVKEFGGLDQLGDRDVAYDRALANLAALPLPTRETVLASSDAPGSAIDLLYSEDFFGAARILVLADLVRRLYHRPIPQTGVLVAIPSRHLLQLHFPVSTDTVLALNAMVQTAVGQFQNQPGPISPYVFHLGPDMAATQVSYLEGNTISVRVEGAAEEMFRMIGLMDSGDQ